VCFDVASLTVCLGLCWLVAFVVALNLGLYLVVRNSVGILFCFDYCVLW